MNITIYKTHWHTEIPPEIKHGLIPDHTYLLCQLANEIQRKYINVKFVDFMLPENKFEVFGIKTSIADCDMLVVADDRVILLSFSDVLSRTHQLLIDRNNSNDILVYPNKGFYSSIYTNVKFKAKSSPYLTRYGFQNLDFYYELRKTVNIKDKMVFRGNYRNLPRQVFYSLREEDERYKHFSGPEMLEPYEYFLDLISHKVGLSVAGVAEFCNRDVEYMAIGLPMMRFEYMGNMEPELIPNVHYISIPRIDNNINHERCCGEENTIYHQQSQYTDRYADVYYNRFLEVKDDQKFLKFISDNARQYYEDYIHPRNRVQHFMNLMEL